MSDDQDKCESVFILVPAYPGSPEPTVVKRLCVCVCVCLGQDLGPSKYMVPWAQLSSYRKWQRDQFMRLNCQVSTLYYRMFALISFQKLQHKVLQNK